MSEKPAMYGVLARTCYKCMVVTICSLPWDDDGDGDGDGDDDEIISDEWTFHSDG